MTNFSADIDFLFNDVPFAQRCRQAKENGFNYVEFTFPEDVGLGDLGDAAAYKGLKVSVMEMPADWAALAFDKKKKAAFLEKFDRMLDVADFIECKKIFVPGMIVPEDKFDESRQAFVSALHAAGAKAKVAGVKILVGFKNPRQNPDFYPASTLEIMELLDELADDRVFAYLFDVYESQTAEGGLSDALEMFLPLIGHIRIAGVPLREEPDTGEVSYDYLLSLLENNGYAGQVGCAYTPRLKTVDGLKWMKKYV